MRVPSLRREDPLEKDMTTHDSIPAWRIPWTEEPGRLQSIGSLRVRHDWATSLTLFTFHFHALEKEMATHSSVLAWRIPGTGEPGGSMGSHRVRHDWSNLAAAAVLRAWPRDLPKGMHFVQGSTWEAESPNHFAVHLKQTNYYKSTIPQFKEKIFPHQKLFQIL